MERESVNEKVTDKSKVNGKRKRKKRKGNIIIRKKLMEKRR